MHTHTHTLSKISSTKGIYLLWFELRMWVLWEINSSIWNGRECQCHSDEDWVMSKGSNGKERGGQSGLPSLLPIHLYLIPAFFFSSLELSFYHSIPLSFLLSVPVFFVSSHPCAFLLPFPPLLLSLPSYWHHSPPCVVMCNVLKLGPAMADCCRYRLISYKSGWSDQLPHRGQMHRKTDIREDCMSKCICVSPCVDTAEVELPGLPGLINTSMTDGTHFQSISLPV